MQHCKRSEYSNVLSRFEILRERQNQTTAFSFNTSELYQGSPSPFNICSNDQVALNATILTKNSQTNSEFVEPSKGDKYSKFTQPFISSDRLLADLCSSLMLSVIAPSSILPDNVRRKLMKNSLHLFPQLFTDKSTSRALDFNNSLSATAVSDFETASPRCYVFPKKPKLDQLCKSLHDGEYHQLTKKNAFEYDVTEECRVSMVKVPDISPMNLTKRSVSSFQKPVRNRKVKDDSSCTLPTILHAPCASTSGRANSKEISLRKGIKRKLSDKNDDPPSPSPPPGNGMLKKVERTVFPRQSFSKQYEVTKKIGSGGGGAVYAGIRKADQLQVAIKKIPKEKIKRWGELDGRNVPIEFELLHKAGSDGDGGIIELFDWFERRDSFVLVMERPLPAIDLFDYLNKHGPMTEEQARVIFRQLVKGVLACHRNGVIHRDIKDENVVLNLKTGEAKIIDFGCGAMLKEEPYLEYAGTYQFYPPEWFLHRKYRGRELDAWSLGVLLYTMTQGEIPFKEKEEILKCQIHYKNKNPTSSYQDLISSMLQKQPDQRLSLCEVLRHDWMKEKHQHVTAKIK